MLLCVHCDTRNTVKLVILLTCINLIGVPRKTNDNTAVLTGCSVLYTVTVVGGTIFSAHAYALYLMNTNNSMHT
jgi:hypothetical protein